MGYLGVWAAAFAVKSLRNRVLVAIERLAIKSGQAGHIGIRLFAAGSLLGRCPSVYVRVQPDAGSMSQHAERWRLLASTGSAGPLMGFDRWRRRCEKVATDQFEHRRRVAPILAERAGDFPPCIEHCGRKRCECSTCKESRGELSAAID
jgi:hypothetical protein